MLTTFISTKETEAQRLLNIAVYIVNQFWQIKGFYLLPRDIPDFSGKEIYFPNLGYQKSFWDEAKRLTKLDWINIPLETDKKTLDQIIKILPDQPPETKKLENAWRKVEKPFWQFCKNTFPNYKFENFEIWVTRYGRLSSFTQNKAWIHFKSNPEDIAEAILSGTFRRKHLKRGYTWEESEAVVDNIILDSKINRLFPNWKPTLVGLRSSSKYATESAAYFKKLGFAEKIELPVENNIFTETETQILKYLQNNAGSILNFETLGDMIWKAKACEKYSEWAIAQTIHRLRNKIQSLGLAPEIIQTKRGRGYYLLS